MKVGFIGNMNNNHFAVVRYLRDSGIDAHLLLTDTEQDHFHPKADTFSLNYMEYTHQLEWGSAIRYLKTRVQKLQEDLRGYDVIMGCGYAPAYCRKARRNLDIFCPYGEDIWGMTKFKLHSPQILASVWAATFSQRRAISQSRVIHLAKNGMFEGQIKKFAPNTLRWFDGFPLVYMPEYENLREDQGCSTHWRKQFDEIREQSDLLLFSSVRHTWTVSAADPNAKGTDKLLKGIKLFKTRFPSVRIKLITMEYGRDVACTKSLAESLGLNEVLVWFPKMYRKDLMAGLMTSDIACAEFENSYNMSGVIYEALSFGKPIMMNRNDSEYDGIGAKSLYRVMNAKSPESIAKALGDYMNSPSSYKALGKSGRDWYKFEVVEKSLKKYIDYIERRTKEAHV